MIRDSVDGFVDADAFACENCLVYAEATGRNREKSAVGRHFVSDGDRYDVTGNELGGMYAREMARAEDICFVGGILFEGLRGA